MSEIIDLSEFDEAYEHAKVEDREDFMPLPDGKYQAMVDRVEVTRAKSGKPMLKWCLKVIVGNHKGRLLWRNNVMVSDANIKWLKQDLQTCGLVLGRLSDLNDRLEELIGIVLEVQKVTKGGNENVYINKRIDSGSVMDDDLPF
jgi:hypothetical protein